MTKPTASMTTCKVINGYYSTYSYGEEEMRDCMWSLHAAAGYDDDTKTVNVKNINFEGVTNAMRILEIAKAEMFAHQALDILKATPTAKVIVALEHPEALQHVKKLFSSHSREHKQDVTLQRGDAALEAFKQPNPDCRLLLTTVDTIVEGIDLADKDGNFSRHLLCSPTHLTKRSASLIGRINRVDAKSPVQVIFMYAKCAPEEADILKALITAMEVK